MLSNHPDKGGDHNRFVLVNGLYEKFMKNGGLSHSSYTSHTSRSSTFNYPHIFVCPWCRKTYYANTYHSCDARFYTCEECGERVNMRDKSYHEFMHMQKKNVRVLCEICKQYYREHYKEAHEKTKTHQSFANGERKFCECGGVYTDATRDYHNGSSKHRKFVDKIIECECGKSYKESQRDKHNATAHHRRATDPVIVCDVCGMKYKKIDEIKHKASKTHKARQPEVCECGGTFTQRTRTAHLDSHQHKNHYRKNDVDADADDMGKKFENMMNPPHSETDESDNKQKPQKHPSIVCECGGKYTTQSRHQHFKTQRHKEYETVKNHTHSSTSSTE